VSVIVGRVVAASGAPVQGANVAVVSGTQPFRDVAATSAADGGFRLGGMQPGRYRVEAHGPGGSGSAEVQVTAGASAEVEIRVA
jgi:hypothetical protein